MIDDLTLNQLRALAIKPVEKAEGDGSSPAILFGVSLFFVVLHSIFL